MTIPTHIDPSGLFIGIAAFLIIGLFHPIVIKAEYHWGTECWWIFLTAGIAGIGASLYINDSVWSAIIGIFAFSSFWSIKELFEQRKRVEKGWFPKNPKHGDRRKRQRGNNSENRENNLH